MVRSCLEYCIPPFWVLLFKKDSDKFEKVQVRAIKMVKLSEEPFKNLRYIYGKDEGRYDI